MKNFKRRASVYVLVIGSSTLLATIGLAALTAMRIERKNLAGTTDFSEARIYAQSAVELALNTMNTDPNWRTTYPNGAWRTNQNVGKGKFTLEVTDPSDNSLSDSQDESVVITGIGIKGEARHQLRVVVSSDHTGLGCTETALHTNGNITFNSTTVLRAGHKVSSNGTITANTSDLYCDIEASGSATGGAYRGAKTSGVPTRSMPSSSAFNYYATNGTSISISSIPYSTLPLLGGVRTMEKVLLSPNSNPYGSNNSQGIYVINCGGQTIRIRNCRIVGTLYLINPSSSSHMEESMLMESPGNLPCLLVNGPMQINTSSSQLSESAGENANFNPVGTPYNGTVDADTNDEYPSIIKGLVYVSGAFSTSNTVTVNGVLIGGGTLTASGTIDVTYDDRFYNSPPPGFDNPPVLSITPGSWVQSVN